MAKFRILETKQLYNMVQIKSENHQVSVPLSNVWFGGHEKRKKSREKERYRRWFPIEIVSHYQSNASINGWRCLPYTLWSVTNIYMNQYIIRLGKCFFGVRTIWSRQPNRCLIVIVNLPFDWQRGPSFQCTNGACMQFIVKKKLMNSKLILKWRDFIVIGILDSFSVSKGLPFYRNRVSGFSKRRKMIP